MISKFPKSTSSDPNILSFHILIFYQLKQNKEIKYLLVTDMKFSAPLQDLTKYSQAQGTLHSDS